MKCKNCDKATTGGSRYCSASCKTVWNRNKRNNVTADVTADVTASVTSTVTPSITNFGKPDCECGHCSQNKGNGNRSIINHGAYKSAGELVPREINRVSLPGDVDYAGVAK